jgi:hypothetical protein
MRVNFLGNNEYLEHYFRNIVIKITILTDTVFKFIRTESFCVGFYDWLDVISFSTLTLRHNTDYRSFPA